MALKAGTRLGSYEIISLLGAGGMGEVYRAHDSRVGRDVAIKVSMEQFSERFEREIRAVASLNHSNICTLYDVGPNYLVMELVEGPTLADRIKQGPIPLEESLEIARQIADALEAAHEKGIVHRDLKPANIKIKPDGTVKVLDFGLAKVGGTPTVSSENSPTLSVAQTAAGVILGTAAYMSPEQAKGKIVDKRADIWAFGVVLYEMLTGKQLFAGETVSDTLASVLKEEPEWDYIPAKARRLLRACLQKDPKKRLADISDAKLLLEDAPESTSAKRPWLAWSIATVCLSILIGLAPIAYFHFREKSPLAEPVRFQISAPVSLAPGGSFAISPDGRLLAFAALSPDGVTRLWVRPLESFESRPLAGTEANHIPPFFWSPDSRLIAFDAGGKLKKVDVFTGAMQTICNLSTSSVGGSWNREGVIIFGTLGGSVMRVSEKGGDPSRLTKLDAARGESQQLFPTFLPDGRHFMYFRYFGKPEDRGLFIGSLDSKPEAQSSKLLLATLFWPRYVPSQDTALGQLLFLRDQTLMTQAFDDKRLELTGEPQPVAEQVKSFSTYGLFSASNNGTLIYRTGKSNLTFQLTWLNREGKILGAQAEGGALAGLDLFSNGARAAVAWQNGLQPFPLPDVWLLNLSSGAKTSFTFGKGSNVTPVWSPDGSRIVFASNREGSYSLYQKPSNGLGNDELLLKTSENNFPTSWSKDGRYLLYTAVDPKTKGDLWVLPMEKGGKRFPFLNTEANEADGRFSPDMRWIAYVSDETGSNEIYVQGFRQGIGGQSADTGAKLLISRGGGIGPRWRRDGKELYYRAPDGKVMAVEVSADVQFRSGTPMPLFQAPPDISVLATSVPLRFWEVSEDGKRFLLQKPLPEGSPEQFNVVLNWTASLKK